MFREIHERYLAGTPEAASDMSDEEVCAELFPSEDWYAEFPKFAAPWMNEHKLAHELRRIREKSHELREACQEFGLTLPMMHAAQRKARALFCDPDGEFGWFFKDMILARRAGSFLFVHAGVDDVVAGILRHRGTDGLNQDFRRLMTENLFELYHGSLGNAFRTKYRAKDLLLTERGVTDMHLAGLYAIVHGHRNVLRGQRMMLRAGILNLECDASLDANTRSIEGLDGPGGAVVIFRPTGRIEAISTDYPYVKTLDADEVFDLTAVV